MAVLGLMLLFAGGASRADEPHQIVVRLAAIAALAASLWRLETAPLRTGKGWLFGVAAAYGLLVLQLVPLPPTIWAQLPGRAVYAEIAQVADVVSWRPLSLTPDLTLNSLFALLPATAAGVAALYLDSTSRRAVWGWLVAAALFSGILGLVQLAASGNSFVLYRETSLDSAVGVFANRNHQAAFLASALPLTGALAGLRLRNTGGTWPEIVAVLALAVVLLLALVATASRTGMALAVIGTVGAIWCFRVTGASFGHSRPYLRALVPVAACAILGAIAFAAVRLGVAERLAVTDFSTETRSELIRPLVRTAGAFMPFGSGFGSFDSVYRQFEPDALLSTIYMNHAHNEPLQLAIEGGLPGLALLGLFLVWWFRTVLRISFAEVPSIRRSTAIAAVFVTAILMISSLFDYPLRTPMLSAIFVVACVEMMRTAALVDRHHGNRESAAHAGKG